MISITLVTQESVITKIFTLICSKLNIDLKISNDNYIEQHSDIIIVDDPFIDDHFNLIKQYSKRLGAITQEDLPFEKAKDFTIPRPFLPSTLEKILNDQIQIIKDKELKDKAKTTTTNTTAIEEDDQELINLANDLIDDIQDNNEDESIIHYSTNKKDQNLNRNVLDSQELSKLQNMLEANDEFFKKINMAAPQELSKEDWVDLADIIDKAIDDVKEYEFEESQTPDQSQTINLVLNQFAMNELRPLLQKLDQNIIDNLVDGKDIYLHLQLKD
jgi:hypothetical protein